MPEDNERHYSALGDSVLIQISAEDYERLLLMMGYAFSAALKEDASMAYSFLDLTNRVNRGNPNWTPYEIPEQYITKRDENR